jgi:hypothetical protein
MSQKSGDQNNNTSRDKAFVVFNSTFSTVGIFTSASITLFLYLLGIRFHSYLPLPLFLLSIGIIISTIVYQIGFLKLNRNLVSAILVEITITGLLFHLIYQMPGYGLVGSDAYADFASMKGIVDSGFVMGVPDYVQITSYFPMLHVIGTQIALVTHLDPLEVAKWFPSIFSVALTPLLFLFIRHVFKQNKAALLGTMLFACLQHETLFGSLFIRETLAIIFALGCVYFYLAAESSNHPLVYRSVSIILLFCTVLSHHLTSMMLIIFIVIHFLVTYSAKLKTLSNRYFPKDISIESISLAFLVLVPVLTFTYWITTIIIPLRALAQFISDLLTPATWGKGTYVDVTGFGFALPTIRYYILVYGSYFCYLVFGLLMLVRIRPRAGSRHIEMYSFTLYLLVCGVLGIVSFFLIPATIIGDRFLAFGWLFGFGALIVAIDEYRSKLLVSSASVLVVIFLFINMFTIHPTKWNPYEPGAGATASYQDFTLAKTVNFKEGSILANMNNLSSIYYMQNVMGGTEIFSLSKSIDLNDFNWIIINRKGLDEEGLYSKATIDTVKELRNLDIQQSPVFNLTYESNNLVLLSKTGTSEP